MQMVLYIKFVLVLFGNLLKRISAPIFNKMYKRRTRYAGSVQKYRGRGFFSNMFSSFRNIKLPKLPSFSLFSSKPTPVVQPQQRPTFQSFYSQEKNKLEQQLKKRDILNAPQKQLANSPADVADRFKIDPQFAADRGLLLKPSSTIEQDRKFKENQRLNAALSNSSKVFQGRGTKTTKKFKYPF